MDAEKPCAGLQVLKNVVKNYKGSGMTERNKRRRVKYQGIQSASPLVSFLFLSFLIPCNFSW